MIKAVFFDLNGVLVTSEYLSDRFERKFGVPSQKFIEALKEIMTVVRRPNAPEIFSLWEPHIEKWGVHMSEDEFLNFWFLGESLDTEVLEYVRELKSKGLKVFVVSNNFRERTQFYRNNFPEIFENLDGSYFSWETGHVKPNTEALQFVLTKHGLDPSAVVYFDNSKKNIDSALETGVDGQEWIDLKTAKDYIHSKS